MDAGATRAISQFFFDIDAFLRFVDEVRRAGIDIPILPGVMPVTNFKGLQRMAAPAASTSPPGSPACSTGWTTTPRPAA